MFTYNFANSLINLIVGRTSAVGSTSQNAETKVGLSYTIPTRSGTNVTEPNISTGYKRKVFGSGTQTFTYLMGNPVMNQVTNVKNIFFEMALENYPDTIKSLLFYDRSNTLIAYGLLQTPIQPLKDEVPVVEPGNLIINMGKVSYFFGGNILNYISARANTVSNGGSVSIGLSSTEPDNTGDNITEPDVTTGYDRVLLGSATQNQTWLMGQAVNGESENEEYIYFPKAIVEYDITVAYFVLYNNSGAMLTYGTLTTPIKPTINTIPMVEIGELKLSI